MSSKRKLKKTFSEKDRKSDTEDEMEDFALQKPKKKRVCLDSGSESESSCLDQNILKNGEESDANSLEDEPLKKKAKNLKVHSSGSSLEDKTIAAKKKHYPVYSSESEASSISSDEIRLKDASDDDTPISNVIKKASKIKQRPGGTSDDDDDDEPISNVIKKKASKNKDSSKEMKPCASDSSEDEPLANKHRKSANSNNQSISKDIHSESEDEVVPTSNKGEISPITSTKLEAAHTSGSSSDDEPLAIKSKNSSISSSGNKVSGILSDEISPRDESDDDDDELISNIIKKKASKIEDRSKEKKACSSDSSEDEPLANKHRMSSEISNNKTVKDLHSESEDESEVSSDKESSNEIIKSSKTNRKSKADSSVDDSEEEFLPVKSKSLKKKPNGLKTKNKSVSGDSLSSDEEPISQKLARASENEEKLQLKYQSSSSADDRPLATKYTVNKKLKSQQSSDLSSDDEEKESDSLSKVKKKIGKKTVSKDKNPSNGKIEHLKKYLRVAGIHVKSYDKLFEDCKSIKSKVEKLLSLLHEKGLKGRPTIEKCKKLKKRIETKKEIAELDLSNIIKSEGRPKRVAGGKIEKTQNVENSPAGKKFMRLQDIIDSEESD